MGMTDRTCRDGLAHPGWRPRPLETKQGNAGTFPSGSRYSGSIIPETDEISFFALEKTFRDAHAPGHTLHSCGGRAVYEQGA